MRISCDNQRVWKYEIFLMEYLVVSIFNMYTYNTVKQSKVGLDFMPFCLEVHEWTYGLFNP